MSMRCNYTIDLAPGKRRPGRKDDAFTLTTTPPLREGCSFSISINGKHVHPAAPGSTSAPESAVGDLRFTGAQFSGASFQALADNPKGNVTFTITCRDPDCGATTTEPFTLGDQPKDKTDQLKEKTLGQKIVAGLIFLGSALTGGILGVPLGPPGIAAGAAIGALGGSILAALLLSWWN